ncbi:hypothetical protein CANCADRAFT_626 [Tortispora caseinolytica NRRL Y-17796]|uniref:Transcription initiation factor IIF subunit alpha n=1 Tax=Tortispora caseinolytica NRRL Y-17796 TaxID=767744 RepID=A0A1E4TJV6_9ASCO|nr:hypothetical protein CANCADRAFT_626 [Tortispora caseinolytica NRRL Y-17796]
MSTSDNHAKSTSSSPGGGNYTEFRLKCATPEEVNGIRHNVMKLHSRHKVDLKSFDEPVRLSRKDPKLVKHHAATNFSQTPEENSNINNDNESKPEPKDLSSVAPDGAGRRQYGPNNRKTRQVFTGREEAQKLRYEEHFPWVLEDFEDKNVWVGNYEAAQSNCYVIFVFDDDGFRMVPVDRWYRFTPRNQFATLSLEEAEAKMSAKDKLPRWFMRKLDENKTHSPVPAPQRRMRMVLGGESSTRSGEADREDLDYEEAFDDDEGAPIIEGPEEENKEVEERIKREMQTANSLDVKDEYDSSEEEKLNQEGRKLKKYLRSLEKNALYESDDEDANPYMSDDSDDSLFNDHDDKTDATTGTNSENSNEKRDQKIPRISGVYSRGGMASISSSPVSRSESPPIATQVKVKKPGSVIIYSSPLKLQKAIGDNNNKRSLDEAGNAGGVSKKIKLRMTSPNPATSDEDDPTLLTAEDIRRVLEQNEKLTAKELLRHLKTKLKDNPKNSERLKGLVKQVAKLKDNYLVLK